MSFSQSQYQTGASQFGGFGGGGGFMNSPNQGGGGGMFSPSGGGGGGSGSFRNHTLVPCTIKQLNQADAPAAGAGFAVDGNEIGHARIIGQIVSVEQQATFTLYLIDDSTGTIEVKVWSNPQDQQQMEKQSGWREGLYVKVFGKMQFFQGQRSLSAHSLMPVVDFNELTHHFLEAIYVHKTRSIKQENPHTSAAMMGNMQQNQPQPQQSFNNPVPPANNMSSVFDDANGLNDVQKQVLTVFSRDTSDEGANINSVFTALKHLPANDIRMAVEFLSTEGHVYATIDEEHFKCTN